MKKFENVRNIIFESVLEGRGIVNFDDTGNKQYYIHNKRVDGLPNASGKRENIKYAKKNFYCTEITDGEEKKKIYEHKIKISAEKYRKYIFTREEEIEIPNPMLINLPPEHQTSILLTANMIERGWLVTLKDTGGLGKKTSLRVTDCEQYEDEKDSEKAISKFDVNSSRGQSDTSFRYTETIGKVKYKVSGDISLSELQFISTDPAMDRMAINSDNVEAKFGQNALNKLSRSFGVEGGWKHSEFADKAKMEICDWPITESGVLFNNDLTVQLAKDILKKIFIWQIHTSTGYAKRESLRIKFIKDVTDFDGEWIAINSINDIENLDFSVYEGFVDVNDKKDIIEASQKAKEDYVKLCKKEMEKEKKNKDKTKEKDEEV